MFCVCFWQMPLWRMSVAELSGNFNCTYNAIDRKHTLSSASWVLSLYETNQRYDVWRKLHNNAPHTHTHHTHTHTHTHTHKHTTHTPHTHTHTHPHPHVGFYGLRGLSIGVMVFILYKLYVLLPYTYPTPKLSPHRRRCISTSPPKKLTLYDL